MAALDFVGQEARNWLTQSNERPRVWRWANLAAFFSRARSALTLVAREKEILLFGVLQWVCIAGTYFLWIEILRWIPQQWLESDDFLANAAVVVWSALCVGLAAFPIGILNGCVGATHFLREVGQPSTVQACLARVMPAATRLWAFQATDAWITVNQIVDRLPRRGGGWLLRRAASELGQLRVVAKQHHALHLVAKLLNDVEQVVCLEPGLFREPRPIVDAPRIITASFLLLAPYVLGGRPPISAVLNRRKP